MVSYQMHIQEDVKTVSQVHLCVEKPTYKYTHTSHKTGKHFSYASPSILSAQLSRVSFKGCLETQIRRNPMEDPDEKSWTQCFFRLQNDTMYRFEDASDAELFASSFDSEREEEEEGGERDALHLQTVISVRVHGLIHNCFSIRTAECTTWYKAGDKDSCNAWVHSIYRAIAEVLTAHRRRCASFDSDYGTTPSPDFKSPIRMDSSVTSPSTLLSMPPLARKRTLKRSPSQAVRRAHRKQKRDDKIKKRYTPSIPIDSKKKNKSLSSKIKISSTAPATMSIWISKSSKTENKKITPFQRTISDPKHSENLRIPGAFERTRSTGARYIPPHRRRPRQEFDFIPESISSSGDEFESMTPPLKHTPPTGSKSPIPMFQLDDNFNTPPPSPGDLVKFNDVRGGGDGDGGGGGGGGHSPLRIGGNGVSSRTFMNASLSDLVQGDDDKEEGEKEDETSNSVCTDFGCTAEQGKRSKMEDRHIAILDLNTHLGLSTAKEFQSFFGVYDGHSGWEAAEYAASNIHEMIVEDEDFDSDMLKSFVRCFLRVDKDYLDKVRQDIENGEKACYAGTTALSVLIRGRRCFVATLGDSLAVLCRDGKAVAISEKCTPGSKSERDRIERAGGWVTEEKELFISRIHHMRMDNEIVRKYAQDSMRWLVTHRVNGELAVSRAIGDPDYKGDGMLAYPWYFNEDHPKRPFTADLVIAEPVVEEFEIKDEDEFILLACDGLWDVITSEDAVEAVSKWLGEGLTAQETTRKLSNLALMLGSADNITIVIVCFGGRVGKKKTRRGSK
jgi:serine/threonine protein phosphatase PrpC